MSEIPTWGALATQCADLAAQREGVDWVKEWRVLAQVAQEAHDRTHQMQVIQDHLNWADQAWASHNVVRFREIVRLVEGLTV